MVEASTAVFQARSYNDVKQHQRAVDVLDDGLRDDPQHAEMLAVLAWSHLYLGNDEQGEQAARASLASPGQPQIEAMTALVQVAKNQGRFDEVCRLAGDVIDRWPQDPVGHMWYALGLCRLSRTLDDRTATRASAATALELGGRTPQLLLNAAWIEAQFDDKPACLALADEGLEQDPSHTELMKLRAWAVGKADYRAKVLMDVLAMDPFDTDAHKSLVSDVRTSRSSLHLLAGTLAIVGPLVVLLPGTPLRLGAIAVLLVALVVAARTHVQYLRGLPPVLVRGATPLRLLAAGAAACAVGLVLFGLDLVVGPFVVLLGLALAGFAKVRGVRDDAHAEPPGSQPRRMTFDGASAVAGFKIVGLLLVALGTWLFGHQFLTTVQAGAVAAPFYLASAAALVVVLTCVAIVVQSRDARGQGRRLVAPVVVGVLAVSGLAVDAVGVVRSMSGDAAGVYRPLEGGRDCAVRYRSACLPRYEPPTFSPPSRVPIPTFTVPTFTFTPPSIDVPDLP